MRFEQCRWRDPEGVQCLRRVASGKEFCSDHDPNRAAPPKIPPDEDRCIKRTHGQRCRGWRMNGRLVCVRHKDYRVDVIAEEGDRRYLMAKYAPEQIGDRYRKALEDPELLDLSDDIALLEGWIGQLSENLDSAGPAASWTKVQTLLRKYVHAKEDRKGECLSELELAVDSAVRESAARAEIASLQEQKRKLTETQEKRLDKKRMYLTVEEANILLYQLATLVRDWVQDGIAAAVARERIMQGLYVIANRKRGLAAPQTPMAVIEAQTVEPDPAPYPPDENA